MNVLNMGESLGRGLLLSLGIEQSGISFLFVAGFARRAKPATKNRNILVKARQDVEP
jgi:hypothetical protein